MHCLPSTDVDLIVSRTETLRDETRRVASTEAREMKSNALAIPPRMSRISIHNDISFFRSRGLGSVLYDHSGDSNHVHSVHVIVWISCVRCAAILWVFYMEMSFFVHTVCSPSLLGREWRKTHPGHSPPRSNAGSTCCTSSFVGDPIQDRTVFPNRDIAQKIARGTFKVHSL